MSEHITQRAPRNPWTPADDAYKAERARELAQAGRYNSAMLEGGAIREQALQRRVLGEVAAVEAERRAA